MRFQGDHRRDNGTNQSESTEETVVDPLPALLGESHGGLLLQSRISGKRVEDPIDGNGSDGREGDGGAGDKIDVIPALNVEAGVGLVVGQLEEGSRVGTKRRVEMVNGQ